MKLPANSRVNGYTDTILKWKKWKAKVKSESDYFSRSNVCLRLNLPFVLVIFVRTGWIKLHLKAAREYLRPVQAKRKPIVLWRQGAWHELRVAGAPARHSTVREQLQGLDGRRQNGVGPRRLQIGLDELAHAQLEGLLFERARERVQRECVEPAEKRRVRLWQLHLHQEYVRVSEVVRLDWACGPGLAVFDTGLVEQTFVIN